MFEKRLRGYRAIGYSEGDAPVRSGATNDRYVADVSQASDSPFQLQHPKALANSRTKHDNASASWSEIELEELVKEATVDCYGDAEQATGLFMMM